MYCTAVPGQSHFQRPGTATAYFITFTGMDLYLTSFISGAGFLLAFLLFFHPLQQNVKANRWLGLFVLIISLAFIGTYLLKTQASALNSIPFKLLMSVQFLLAPCLLMSMLYFVNPEKSFKARNLIHFIPFLLYVLTERFGSSEETISVVSLFSFNNQVSFLVRDILPFQTLFYLVLCYFLLKKHQANLQLITATMNQISLNWLLQFLFILFITVLVWLNDAFFEFPLITETTPYLYTIAIFFLAYFSIKQKSIFSYGDKDITAIAALFRKEEIPLVNQQQEERNLSEEITPDAEDKEVLPSVTQKNKSARLDSDQLNRLSEQLKWLMNHEKIYLDNDLNLPGLAHKLGIGIHDASYLINETTGDNFYNFINRYRVEEAKRLLNSSKINELNILGIAFAAGFNSKTTFNTTFKKLVGMSPTQFCKKRPQ